MRHVVHDHENRDHVLFKTIFYGYVATFTLLVHISAHNLIYSTRISLRGVILIEATSVNGL